MVKNQNYIRSEGLSLKIAEIKDWKSIEKILLSLLDDFYGVVWALRLAGSADETFISIYGIWFALFNLEHSYGACVDTRSAPITFFNIDFNLNHDYSASILEF